MQIIHSNQSMTDEERASILFSGDLIVYRQVSAMQDLCRYTDDFLRQGLSGHDPRTVQDQFSSSDYLHKMGILQKQFRTSHTPKTHFFRALVAVGVQPLSNYWDHFPLRVVPSRPSHEGAMRAGIGHHRDTWGSNIHSQINWWAPIYPLERERTIAFYPHYWDQPIANNTDSWSFQAYLANRKATPDERAVDYPSAPSPQAPIDESGVKKIVIEPGDILCFASAHLHASVPNTTEECRFSVEMRTVSLDNLQQQRTAPNVDNAASTPMYKWFKRIADREPLNTALSQHENKCN